MQVVEQGLLSGEGGVLFPSPEGGLPGPPAWKVQYQRVHLKAQEAVQIPLYRGWL